MKSNYVQDSTGLVYKMLSGHLLKLSPWSDNEDRRIHEYNLNDYTMITYENACMIVNNQFDNTVEEWNKNGKHYIADKPNTNLAIHSHLITSLPNHKIVIKDSSKLLEYVDNLSITSDDGTQELKMIKHKGKIHYILILKEFLPRVQAYNVFGEFVQWLGIKHCKPIFNETDNKYL